MSAQQADDGLTQYLVAVRDGGRPAMDALFEQVYDRLKVLARAKRRGSSPLDTTEILHEAYLRFVDAASTTYNDRHHFLAVAGRAMRQILVDEARRVGAAKRGGKLLATTLQDHHASTGASVEEVLAVDEALTKVAATSQRLVSVVELCFFGGLTTEQAGEALGLSARTVKREWQKAKMLLGALLRAP